MHSFFPTPGSPIPGANPPARALFIDRWGTLLERPKQGWCARFADAELTPGALDALFRACQAGWRLYLIGNECQVAFGRQSLATWQTFEADLLEHLRSYGVTIGRDYACTDHPEGKGRHARDSVFLLPNTGALYHAAQCDAVSLGDSWVIGDSTLELVAGWRGGLRLAGVRSGLGLSDGEYEVEPEIQGDTLSDVVYELLSAERIAR